MKEDFSNRKSSIVMPVLVGSALGASLALLLAPKKGTEMRRDLKRFAANTLGQSAEVIDESKDLYDDGREAVARAIKAGRETYDEGIKRLEKLMHKKERSLMVPILASGIIGAGIALLLTSKTGKEARGDLKRIAAQTRDKIVSAMDKSKVRYKKGNKAMPETLESGKKARVPVKRKLRHAS